MSRKGKTIDYLFEDPPIQNQKYALVSIVGPNMPQKCDVWGLKVRAVADTMEKAKQLSQKILKVDNHYDIYTVEIGKFFPLAVEPLQLDNVEYQNTQLNELIKSYLENKEHANDQWHQRKNEMIQEAIREGKNQEELANRPEHPISVLQRIKTYEKTLQEMQEHLQSLESDLEKSKTTFANYTQEERDQANLEIEKAIDTTLNEIKNESEDHSVEEIRKQLMNEFTVNENGTETENKVDGIIQEINKTQNELSELKEFQHSITQSSAPNVYNRISRNIQELEEKLVSLKEQLTNKEIVNDYINKNYGEVPI